MDDIKRQYILDGVVKLVADDKLSDDVMTMTVDYQPFTETERFWYPEDENSSFKLTLTHRYKGACPTSGDIEDMYIKMCVILQQPTEVRMSPKSLEAYSHIQRFGPVERLLCGDTK